MHQYISQKVTKKTLIRYRYLSLVISSAEMLYHYWGSGICPSSEILNTREKNFRKLNLFPSTHNGMEAITLLGF
jgi:hypothetical protein